MSPTVFAAVLTAALLHAVWNALVKSGGDRLLVLAAVNCTSALAAVPMVAMAAFPAAESWPWLLSSAVLHCGYYFFLVQAYQVGDLAHVYPLARGTAPLLVTGGAALLAGEVLPTGAVVGVCIACAGIVSLAFEGGPPWRRDARAVWYALATSGFIGAYTIVDGLGVRASGSPLGYIGWLFLIDGIPITVFALARRPGVVRPFLRREWWRCTGVG
ncbi:MAG: EamA family transporter, partial [Planctomycetes bacterium]|nr:EamA family transporter [Planctomycetota bacterium]